MLFALSFGIELTALLVSIWLGLYLVTHSGRRAEAWLAAMTTWLLGGLFLNMLFSLDPPAVLALPTYWQRWLLIFWPEGILQQDPAAWLRGWTSTIAPAFWFHATMMMRSGKLKARHWIAVGSGYLVVAVGIAIQALQPETYKTVSGDPIFLNSLHGGILYALFLCTMIIFCSLSIFNLILAAQAKPHYLPRRQLIWLSAATVLAALTGPAGLVAAFLGISEPMFIIALLLGCSMVVAGHGVARYSALMEQRIFYSDFIYSAVITGTATAFCLGITLLLGQVYSFPIAVYVMVGVVAVVSFSLLDLVRHKIDYQSSHKEKHVLRDRLRGLESSGDADTLRNLSICLDTICQPIEASYAVLLVHQEGQYTQAAAYHWAQEGLSLAAALVTADDLKLLQGGELPAPLTTAALLLPVYMGEQQVGVLVLGPAEHGMAYSLVETESIQEFNDYLASRFMRLILSRAAQQEDKEAKVMLEPQLWPSEDGKLSTRTVEMGLRNLHDYGKLADTPLAELGLVRQRLGDHPSRMDIGQAVHGLLCEVLEDLRPTDGSEHVRINGVPRDWYPYIILRDAYLDCLPNREIMGRLYVSEGTFNRTRRSAIQSLTVMLRDMQNGGGG